MLYLYVYVYNIAGGTIRLWKQGGCCGWTLLL